MENKNDVTIGDEEQEIELVEVKDFVEVPQEVEDTELPQQVQHPELFDPDILQTTKEISPVGWLETVLPRYGNWGGWRWSDGRFESTIRDDVPPVDDLDALFRIHDLEYAAAKTDKDYHDADRRLVVSIDELLADPGKLSADGRLAALAARALFSHPVLSFIPHLLAHTTQGDLSKSVQKGAVSNGLPHTTGTKQEREQRDGSTDRENRIKELFNLDPIPAFRVFDDDDGRGLLIKLGRKYAYLPSNRVFIADVIGSDLLDEFYAVSRGKPISLSKMIPRDVHEIELRPRGRGGSQKSLYQDLGEMTAREVEEETDADSEASVAYQSAVTALRNIAGSEKVESWNHVLPALRARYSGDRALIGMDEELRWTCASNIGTWTTSGMISESDGQTHNKAQVVISPTGGRRTPITVAAMAGQLWTMVMSATDPTVYSSQLRTNTAEYNGQAWVEMFVRTRERISSGRVPAYTAVFLRLLAYAESGHKHIGPGPAAFPIDMCDLNEGQLMEDMSYFYNCSPAASGLQPNIMTRYISLVTYIRLVQQGAINMGTDVVVPVREDWALRDAGFMTVWVLAHLHYPFAQTQAAVNANVLYRTYSGGFNYANNTPLYNSANSRGIVPATTADVVVIPGPTPNSAVNTRVWIVNVTKATGGASVVNFGNVTIDLDAANAQDIAPGLHAFIHTPIDARTRIVDAVMSVTAPYFLNVDEYEALLIMWAGITTHYRVVSGADNALIANNFYPLPFDATNNVNLNGVTLFNTQGTDAYLANRMAMMATGSITDAFGSTPDYIVCNAGGQCMNLGSVRYTVDSLDPDIAICFTGGVIVPKNKVKATYPHLSYMLAKRAIADRMARSVDYWAGEKQISKGAWTGVDTNSISVQVMAVQDFELTYLDLLEQASFRRPIHSCTLSIIRDQLVLPLSWSATVYSVLARLPSNARDRLPNLAYKIPIDRYYRDAGGSLVKWTQVRDRDNRYVDKERRDLHNALSNVWLFDPNFSRNVVQLAGDAGSPATYIEWTCILPRTWRFCLVLSHQMDQEQQDVGSTLSHTSLYNAHRMVMMGYEWGLTLPVSMQRHSGEWWRVLRIDPGTGSIEQMSFSLESTTLLTSIFRTKRSKGDRGEGGVEVEGPGTSTSTKEEQ